MEYIDLRKEGKGGLREIRRQVVRLKKLGKTGKGIEESAYARIVRAKYGQRINERAKHPWNGKSMGESLEATWFSQRKNREISGKQWKRKYQKLSEALGSCGRWDGRGNTLRNGFGKQ